MTQERFLKLLENPDLLTSISYEELKTLALAYPYAHNLRYLLAIKARQDNHPDFNKALATASAYSLDRTRLFTLVAPKSLVPQPLVQEEEELVLELKPIEIIQRELQAKAPVPVPTEKSSAADTQKSVATEPPTDKGMPAPDVALDLTQPLIPVSKPGSPDENASAGPEPDNTSILEEKAREKEILIGPTFAVWVNQFNPPQLAKPQPVELPGDQPTTSSAEDSPDEEDVPAETGQKTTSSNVAQQLAEKSVTENKDLISETLARLYAQQGYRDKAIAMYQRLSLAFPEKTAYFAAEIEKLKK